ncbi:DNA polymerase III subunit delta [Amphibacillus cookii]|uniref:DNA polymerase III subunit delta n=1 Tax=Amphibacillus cookii TaxID=767787 RepID=UPI001958A181|nr:DNA polymerase III subunit delta [Amphibacillus cookii]MBM7541692.1 DNA polymerase-3 subunit delta [Amphibacillus cookii]
MNYMEAVEHLKQQVEDSVFLIYGEEQYLIEKIVEQIINVKLDKIDVRERLEHVIRFDLDQTAIDEVILEVETYPFLGGDKVVIADQASFLTAKPSKTSIEHDTNRLINYLNDPVDFSVLILIAPYEKIDERKKIAKRLKKSALTICCEEVKPWHLDKWVEHMIKSYHIVFEHGVQELLISEAGANLSILEKEIEKLSLNVGEGGTVTLDIAKNLISHQGNTSGLKLVDTVLTKDLQLAIQTYKDLLRLNEEPIALVALLASQLRVIYQVKLLQKKGYSQKQMAQQLKLHPYVVKMGIERERRFSLNYLYYCIGKCAETDQAIKQGKVEKNLAFELLLYQLINA